MPGESVSITREIADKLLLPIRGQGGFQDLLRKLQRQLHIEELILHLDEDDLEKIPRYKTYEPGGYEERMAHLVDILKAQGLLHESSE